MSRYTATILYDAVSAQGNNTIVNHSYSNEFNQGFNETIFANLTEEQKQARIEEIESFIKRLNIDLKTDGVSKDILFSNTKDIIYEWALALEELHYLGKYEGELNTISSHIKKEIGKLEGVSLDKKEKVWSWMHQVIPDRLKLDKNNKRNINREKLGWNASEKQELTEEGQYMLDSITSMKQFYHTMVSVFGVLENHLKNPNINADMLEHFDEYGKIAELREIVDFMQDGDGCILEQMMDELNIRKSATILQKAIAFSMQGTLSAREMAHFFSISPRQNQRIRNRLEDWPRKRLEMIIRKNILNYRCNSCGMHIITGKKYNNNGEEAGTVKIYNKSYSIPEKYKGRSLNPIKLAMEISRDHQNKNQNTF